MLLWNVEGLKSILNLAPDNLLETHDVNMLTETFTTEPAEIPGYYSIHALATQETGRPSGGVSCYYKPVIGRILNSHTQENLIFLETTRLYIAGMYCRPQEDPADITAKLLGTISQMRHDKPALIAGDLNCRLDQPNLKTKEVLKCLAEEGFILINEAKMKTYFAPNGCSTIDLVFYRGKISHGKQTGKWNSGTAPLRKHLPITTEFRFNEDRGYSRKEEQKTTNSRKIDPQKLSTERMETAETLIQDGNINAAVEILINTIKEATIPAHTKQGKMWFDHDCYQKRKRVLELLHDMKANQTPEHMKEYSKARKEYKNMIKEKKMNT